MRSRWRSEESELDVRRGWVYMQRGRNEIQVHEFLKFSRLRVGLSIATDATLLPSMPSASSNSHRSSSAGRPA